MNETLIGKWIGLSTSYLPREVASIFETYFYIQEYGDDVSILSHPKVEFCFFFYEKNTSISLLQSAIYVSKNLDKKLILIHQGELPDSLLKTNSIYDYCDINSVNIIQWIEQLRHNLSQYFVISDSIKPTIDQVCKLDQKTHFFNKDISDILHYIDTNLDQSLREEDVANYCHYSVTYFSKVFHRSIGITFRDYVIAKRIAMAKKRLIENHKTKISSIAYQCGYRDVSYFSRIFKKKTGVSPGIYRLNHTNSVHIDN
ncbi:hypothetical protein BCU68_06020 [Vibrio sp. 10N.286.49.B3]|uniref:helix-turn-helix domain-containing protein n=1 Tax=Vibrio sp. 10N.286.49.B3 TaxID=1880855 RepID=UPI000C845BF9|nr:AraC family transcriptional regulator [Vibrio sp. 10N.286.49.B3]PMH41233.1 hypothetical protein BCU68_06020 [Vibrio sp. 10N.286.49.B3]